MIANHTNGHHSDPDMFDVAASVRSLWDAVRHHRNVVIVTCVLTFGLTYLYVKIWPPIYRADAMVMSEKDTDPTRDTFYQTWDVFRKDDAKSELELIAAGPVLREVIQREKLTYDDVYHPPLSEVGYLWEKSWVGKHYHALRTKYFPDPDEKALTPEMINLGKTMMDMHAGITVVNVGEANIATITVRGPNRRVADITNTMLAVYLEHRRARYSSEAEKAYEILTKEVADAEAHLSGLEKQRLAFSQQHGLIFDFQKEMQELKDMTDLESRIAVSRATVAQMGASLQRVNSDLAKEPPTSIINTAFEVNTLRETAKLRRLDLQNALIQMRDHYREDSPEVQEVVHDIAQLDTLIATQPEKVEKGNTQGLNLVRQELITKRHTLEAELEGERAGLAVMEREEAQLHGQLSEVPAVKFSVQAMERELQVAGQKYTALALKQAQAAVTVATSKAAMPSVRVVEHATPPGAKYWPKTKYLYPGALLIGLLLGVIAAQVRSLFGGRVRRTDVEQGRGMVPLYATVGLAPEGRPLVVLPRTGTDVS